MDKETLINEFFDRVEACAQIDGDEFDGYDVTFDRTKARKALDRLFLDLRDFAGLIWVQGETGGVIRDDLEDRVRRAQDVVRAALSKDGE